MRFGEGLYPEGRFASRALAQIIFEDPLARREVEQMVHPAVLRRFELWKEQQGRPLVALESAILFSSGFNRFCTDILWVDAPEDERLQRIVQRDGATREEAMRRIEAQRNNTPPEGSRVYRIDNSADQAWYRSFFLSYYHFLPLSPWCCGGGAWRLLFYRYFCGSLIKD